MRNDAILLGLAAADFRQLVEDAFLAYEKGPTGEPVLIQSPITECSLVTSCLLTGESLNRSLRKVGMQSLLRWAVDKQRPYQYGKPDTSKEEWYNYLVLYDSYFKGVTREKLAEELGYSAPWVMGKLKGMLTIVAELLHQELKEPQDLLERKHYVIEQRYAEHSAEEQRVLRRMAVFEQPIRLQKFQDIALQELVSGNVDQFGTQGKIQKLIDKGFWVRNLDGILIQVHPEVKEYLLFQTWPDERRGWHHLAGEHYEEQHNYLQAAWHWREAEKYECAATVLIENYRAIVDEGKSEELYAQVAQFRKHELEETSWARLKIIMDPGIWTVNRAKIKSQRNHAETI